MKNKILVLLIFSVLFFTNFVTGQNPVSDPSNNDAWVLNTAISDEFNGTELDKTKWWILGENGDYRNKWKGRAPGQFVAHNVAIENGDLILKSKWEPTFNFANEKNNGVFYGGTSVGADKSRPITQACVMSESYFRYGYMEIRAKIADAPVTSAFWTTGYHSEIDMVENYGKRPIGNPENTSSVLEKKLRTNMISWDPDQASDHKNWKVEDNLGVRLAEDYHVYGFEWDKDYIKTYFDGRLIRYATRAQLEANDQWRHQYPQEIWLDSEVFYWYGLPSQTDLVNPAEFKIDYVRIWQKEANHTNFNAFGFEGPFHYQGRSRNWWNAANAEWRIKDEKPASGDFSFRFKHSGSFSGNYSTYSPYGSLSLPSGSNTVKFKVWIDPNTSINQLDMILQQPWIQLKFDLTNVKKGEWVELTKTFNRNGSSDTSLTNGDRVQIRIQSANIKGSEALMYLDDIIFNDNTASTASINKIDFSIYPNPSKNSFKVKSSEEGELQVYNLSGALVKTIDKTNSLLDVTTDNLSKGVYLVKLISENKQAIRKLVVK